MDTAKPQAEERTTDKSSFLYRERRNPVRFTINALQRVLDDDEPLSREALKGTETIQWKAAIGEEVNMVDKMDCWKLVNSPRHQKNITHEERIV